MTTSSKSIDEARRMFARPRPDNSAEERVASRKTERIRGVMAEARSNVNLEKMAMEKAKRSGKRYALLPPAGKERPWFDAVLLFGKHSGAKVSDMAREAQRRDYLVWMSGQEFDDKLMEVIKEWLART